MKLQFVKRFAIGLMGLSLLAGASGHAQHAPSLRTAIFGGFYGEGNRVIDDMRASGFTTVILWTIHVRENGDLIYNEPPIVQDGVYVGNKDWPADLKRLRRAPSSVKRIEIGVASWGGSDFKNIRAIVENRAPGCGSTLVCGTGPDSILARNFKVLRKVTGADAVNFDDESEYHAESATRFGQMLGKLGYKVTLAPYTQMPFWVALKQNLGKLVDIVYLQTYDGGAWNKPDVWSRAMGMAVDPGYWSWHAEDCTKGDGPEQMRSKLSETSRRDPATRGSFIWHYGDIQRCREKASIADYARALGQGVSRD